MRLLVERASRGDAKTLDALADAGRVLGLACATVVNLLAPNTVVLGGIYAPLFPWLIRPLREELDRKAFLTRYGQISVVRSELGASGAVRGAASLTLRAVCDDPYLVGSSRP